MAGTVDARIAELGITLPEAMAPAAAYTPTVAAGGLLYVSGQIPKDGDTLITGRIGDGEQDVAHGQAAARLCALNLVSQVKAACGGDLDRVVRVVKLLGFVNAAPGFDKQHLVVNGASEAIQDIFGPAGVHARSAVGCSSLPLNVSVEVEGIFEVR